MGLADAIARISRWMRDNDAPLLADNLAPGASAATLDDAAAELGFAIPAQLRELWSLHDGQREELNGFVMSMDLLGVREALGERRTVAMFVGFVRDAPAEWAEAGVTADELRSDGWIAFAGRDSDLLVVSAVSGRVFTCGKDVPALHLSAGSIVEWFERYATGVEAGEYYVEEGFGDYFLAEGAGYDDEEDVEDDRPLVEQLRAALERRDESWCQDVFRDARDSPAELAQCTHVLFEATQDPNLIARAIRLALNTIVLSSAQWEVVATGAGDNHSLRTFAQSRSRDTPSNR